MSGYPIVLVGLAGQRCVVVGGGPVAARKAAGLAEAGARPVVISPELSPEMESLVGQGRVELLRRPYRTGDLAGAALAIAATDERAVNGAVAREGRRQGTLVNVVDDPGLCTFTAPAVVRRGGLTIAISTGGGSPALARHLRETLEAAIDPAYGDLLDLLAALRPRLRRDVPPEAQGDAWERLLDGELLTCLRTGGKEAARERAEQMLAELSRPGGAA